jgi:hypothetical protein
LRVGTELGSAIGVLGLELGKQLGLLLGGKIVVDDLRVDTALGNEFLVFFLVCLLKILLPFFFFPFFFF